MVTAHDPNVADTLTYSWTVTDQSTGDPVPSFDGVPGDGSGQLIINWPDVVAAVGSWDYEVSCTVTDGKSAPVPATTLVVFLQCYAPKADTMVPGTGQSGDFIDNAQIHTNNTVLVDGPDKAIELVQGGTIIEGTDVQFFTENDATVDFDLTGAPGGMYKIQVVNGCGSQDTSDSDLFEVTCPVAPVYEINPAEVFEGGPVILTITISYDLIDGPSLGFAVVPFSSGPEIVATSVDYVDASTISGVVDLPHGSADNYKVKIINGCGSEFTTSEYLLTVDPLWNISFATGGTPLDVCIDPMTGDFLVLFQEHKAIRCYRESYYRQYSEISLPSYMPLTRIDCASNGYWFAGGFDAGFATLNSVHFDSTDTQIIENSPLYGYEWFSDAFCMSSAATFPNDHFLFTSGETPTYAMLETVSYQDSSFLLADAWVLIGTVANDHVVAPGYLHSDLLMGLEADPTGDAIWTVEDGNYPYACKWSLNYPGGSMSYASVYFGDGVGDAGLYWPLDITSAKDNHMYVLDWPNDYRIKAFDNMTGAAYTPGILVEMNASPKRIDGCVGFGGILAVIGWDATNWYVNIYDSDELP
jgi:hypothetical protein